MPAENRAPNIAAMFREMGLGQYVPQGGFGLSTGARRDLYSPLKGVVSGMQNRRPNLPGLTMSGARNQTVGGALRDLSGQMGLVQPGPPDAALPFMAGQPQTYGLAQQPRGDLLDALRQIVGSLGQPKPRLLPVQRLEP